MSNKIDKCIKCGRIARLTRNLCATRCYPMLLRNGSLNRIEKRSLPIILSAKQKELLIGSLLGDGCLFTPDHKKYNPIFSIKRNLNDLKYLEYEFDFFKNFCLSGIYCYEIYDDRTKKIYKQSGFTTRRCPLFSPYYQKWYPNGEKIIPKDLKLNPFICAIWFCDDGCIVEDKKNRLKIKLSTHGFPNKDTLWLSEYLSCLLHEHFSVVIDQEHAFIVGADAAAKAFIKYISNVIPISMSRKITWKESHFMMSRTRPYLKNRLCQDLNKKEILILDCLTKNNNISSIEICQLINWVGKNNRIPSAYFRYLQKFLKNEYIKDKKIVINGKSNIKYNITIKGKQILNEALFFNSQTDKIT